MKKIIFHIVFLISHCCLAQQSELKQLCIGIRSKLEGNASLHLDYSITVKEREGDEGTMDMHLYRKGNLQRLVFGEAQEVIQQGESMLIVNYMQKTLTLQQDTTGDPAYSLLNELNAMIDSATSITQDQKGDMLSFALNYETTFLFYSKVMLTFSKKTKNLVTVYAEFSADYPLSYDYMKVNYQNWNTSWKPEPGFPFMDKFITRSGNDYQAQTAWKQYQFFQSQRGTLKF